MDMVKQWWNGQDSAPQTAEPKIERVENKVVLSTATKGASIGYRKSIKDTWTLYQKPFTWQKGDSLYVVAHRIGYEKTFAIHDWKVNP